MLKRAFMRLIGFVWMGIALIPCPSLCGEDLPRILAKQRPEQAKNLHGRLLAWRKSVNAPMPTLRTADTLPVKIRKSRRNK